MFEYYLKLIAQQKKEGKKEQTVYRGEIAESTINKLTQMGYEIENTTSAFIKIKW